MEDSSPRRVKAECLWDRLIQAPLPYCFKSPFETKRPLVQQVRAIHSTDSGLGPGPGSEQRHFSQNNRVGGGEWGGGGGGEPTAAAEWLPLAISQICAASGEGRWPWK